MESYCLFGKKVYNGNIKIRCGATPKKKGKVFIMLVSAKEMLQKAKAGHYAVARININNLE